VKKAGCKYGVQDTGHVEYDKSMHEMGPRHAHRAIGLKVGKQLRTGIESVEK
jgi:hypothetical protein